MLCCRLAHELQLHRRRIGAVVERDGLALRLHELDRFTQLQVREQVQRVEERAGDPSAGVAIVAAAAGERR